MEFKWNVDGPVTTSYQMLSPSIISVWTDLPPFLSIPWSAAVPVALSVQPNAVPLSAEDIRSLSLSDLVDFICSPGVRVADAAKLAAQSVLPFHEELSQKQSMRVIKGCLYIVELHHKESVGAIRPHAESLVS